MFGYPLFLDLKGRTCLVFGGGEVAFRKIQALLKRGAKVKCVSKEFSAPLKKLARGPRLELRQARNGSVNLTGAELVIAATSDRNFNARVARACRKKKIWINVVDDPELCDFYVPAVVERGPLQVAISTGGASPLFAKRLREELEKVIPASTGDLLTKLGATRKKLMSLRGGRRPTKQPQRLLRSAPRSSQ